MVMTASLTASAYASVPTVEDIYNSYPVYDGNDLELIVDNSGTHFTLWSPAVQNVRVLIYDKDRNGVAIDTLEMHPEKRRMACSRSTDALWQILHLPSTKSGAMACRNSRNIRQGSGHQWQTSRNHKYVTDKPSGMG